MLAKMACTRLAAAGTIQRAVRVVQAKKVHARLVARRDMQHGTAATKIAACFRGHVQANILVH